MLQKVEPAGSPMDWFSLGEIAALQPGEGAVAQHLRAMADWTRSFLMAPHAGLGRLGDVCPFTAQAARINALRFAVSPAGSRDKARAASDLLAAFKTFDSIPFSGRMANFRAALVAFPHCRDEAGRAMLVETQRRLRPLSFRTGRMIGLFHDRTEAPGLWNPDFRPLRAPLPILAIRALVEQDAAFVLRHPLLAPTYLKRFRVAGGRRLVAQLLRRA